MKATTVLTAGRPQNEVFCIKTLAKREKLINKARVLSNKLNSDDTAGATKVQLEGQISRLNAEIATLNTTVFRNARVWIK